MDQQLQDLIIELRQVSKELQRLTKLPSAALKTSDSALNDKNTNKLIAAMGVLANKLTIRSRHQENIDVKQRQAMSDFIKQVQRAADQVDYSASREAAARGESTDAINDESRARSNSTDAIDNEVHARDAAAKRLRDAAFRDEVRRRNETARESRLREITSDEIGRLGTVSSLFGDSLLGTNKRTIALKAGMEAMGKVVMSAAHSLRSLAGSVNSGNYSIASAQQTVTSFTKSVGSVADTLGSVISGLSWFLPGGALVKGAIFAGGQLLKLGGSAGKLYAELEQVGAEQTQKQLDSYRQLSAAGVMVKNGLVGIADLVATAGMTNGQLEQFNQLITNNSKSLAIMGTTATHGAEIFAKAAGKVFAGPAGRQLELMGIRQEEQNELTMRYLGIITRTGQIQLRNNAQLELATKRSVEFATEMAAVANLTGIQRQELAAAIEAQQADSRLRAAITKAEREGNEAEVARLRVGQTLAAVASAQGDEKMAKGIVELTASGGLLLSEDSVAAMQAGFGEAVNTGDLGKAIASLDKTMPQYLQSLESLIPITGDIANLTTSYAKQQDFQNTLLKAATAAQAQGQPLTVDFLKSLMQAKPAAAGQKTEDIIDAERLLKATAQAQDSVIKRFNYSAGILATASEAYMKAVDKFAEAIDAEGVSSGRIDVKKIKMATGGVLSGPLSGYPVEMHGTEAVVPLPDGKTIPVKIDTGKPGTVQTSGKKSVEPPDGFYQTVTKLLTEVNTGVDKSATAAESTVDDVAKLASIDRLLKRNVDDINDGLAFGRNDEQLDLEEKSMTALQQIRDLLLELSGADIPKWEIGGGTSSDTSSSLGEILGTSAPAAGGSSVSSVSDYKPSNIDLPADGKPRSSAGAQEMQQKTMEALRSQGINDPKAIANIMSQVQHESAFRPRAEEVEKYSPEYLFKTYGAGQNHRNKVRFQNLQEAKDLVAQGPEAVGNKIYGGRMGNAADEGYKYRGRGLIQLTGKYNYEKYGKMIGVDLVSNPDLANDPDVAAQLAAAYFKDKEKRGTDLTNIASVGASVGYAGGDAETARRAKTAQGFMSVATAPQAAANDPQVPKAAKGGILSGPLSGFPAELHGTEAVVPLPDGKSIPVEMPGLASISELLNSLSNMSAPATQSAAKIAAPVLPTTGTGVITQLMQSIQSGPATPVTGTNDLSQLADTIVSAVKGSGDQSTAVPDLLQQLVALQQQQNAAINRLISVSTA